VRRNRGPARLRVRLVLAAQIYLIAGFVWFATAWWAGPNDESIRFNLFGLGVAAVLAVAAAMWWRGTSWPLRILNVFVAGVLLFTLFVVYVWGSAAFLGFPGVVGTTALGVGLIGALFSALAAGFSPTVKPATTDGPTA
jgi:hypothetical protein